MLSFSLYPNLDYDPVKSFAPVAMLAYSPQVLVIAPSVPATTVREFVTHAKANPGRLNFGFGLGVLGSMPGKEAGALLMESAASPDAALAAAARRAPILDNSHPMVSPLLSSKWMGIPQSIDYCPALLPHYLDRAHARSAVVVLPAHRSGCVYPLRLSHAADFLPPHARGPQCHHRWPGRTGGERYQHD